VTAPSGSLESQLPAQAIGQPVGDFAAGAPSSPRAAVHRPCRVAAVGIPAAVLSGWFAGHLVHTAVINRFQGDFLQHMQFAASGMRGDPVPGNFLLYLLLAIFSGFTPEPGRMLSALVVVIAAATAAKAWLSVIFVSAESRRAQLRRAPVFGIVAAALCLFTFSPPVANIYLGQIPPNVWHNSTTMLLMPFAIGMFWSSL
jgi:hypothetical protein